MKSVEMMKNKLKEFDCQHFPIIETSAKMSQNVKQVFTLLAKSILQRQKEKDEKNMRILDEIAFSDKFRQRILAR